jgi:glycosyltransferase involved in cell wall biosynthesis
VLNAQTACLVTPDDTQALAAGITEVLADPQAAQIRADTAKASVAEYDWKRRAQHIVSFIESH